jgi:hypothetical protein
MRNQRNTLLAGIAGLALLAGTGLAAAQEPQDHNSAPQAKQPQAAQPMNKGPAAGRMDQSTQEQKPADRSAETNKADRADKAVPAEKRAQTGQRQPVEKKGAMTQRKETNAPRTAEEPTSKTGQTTAQVRERNGMKGLQGNASGMNVQLSDQQRTQIRNTVLNVQGAPRIGNVNFDVAVGTVIPRDSIRIVPVPETLVRIEPRWRGFLYFVYEDEVIIVNPRDMRIVAVVPA